jgi:hypothetical protein
LATPVYTSQEVSVPAAKMTCPSSAASCIQIGRSQAIKNFLICWKRGKILKMLLPSPWSWLADGKKCLGTKEKMRYRPGEQSLGKKEFWATITPKQSWNHQLLHPGYFDQITHAFMESWTTAWSVINQGIDHKKVLYDNTDPHPFGVFGSL